MGCGASRSSPTSPVLRSTAHDPPNDDWMMFAPPRQTCSNCGQPQTLPYYLAYSSSSRSSFTSSSTWVGNSTVGTDYGSGNSQSYSVIPPSTQPSPSSSSSCGGASRSLSLLSTPTFHSPSSHPRNGLSLDPTLFSHIKSPSVGGVRNTKLDTDCASRFSGSSHSPSVASSTSSYNCGNRRYPLTPLSVRTEPFPR